MTCYIIFNNSYQNENMEIVCKDMGLSMTTAFTIFATRVTKEKRIPFEVSADPFYDEKMFQE